MKQFLFDSHKLMYHCDRVGDFTRTGDCYPLYLEISPVGSCNHRCIFCAYDFIGHPNRKLETGRLMRFIDEIKQAGVRSVLYAGEGEPLLHADISKIIRHTKQSGIDVGLFTNGHLLHEKLAREITPSLTFIRFSFNAGNRQTYAAIHQVKEDSFDAVVGNIASVAFLKRKKKLAVDIGIQFVLLPENADSLLVAVKTIRKTGADYFVIKPFVHQSNQQSYRPKKDFGGRPVSALLDTAERLSGPHFKVIARKASFDAYGKRNYRHCCGTSFISVLNSAGDVATCLPYWDKKKFVFGNIYASSFKDLWNSARRKRIKKYLETTLDVRKCPPNCRPHAINDFLWEITHPGVKHVNFI